MRDTINVQGQVLVCDILAALEPMVDETLLTKLDASLEKRSDERIMFDDCQVLADDAANGLPESYFPSEELADELDEHEMMTLAEAIRCGDRQAAELSLDALFRGEPTIREWIDRGRHSKKAREAKAAGRAAPKLRDAA